MPSDIVEAVSRLVQRSALVDATDAVVVPAGVLPELDYDLVEVMQDIFEQDIRVLTPWSAFVNAYEAGRKHRAAIRSMGEKS